MLLFYQCIKGYTVEPQYNNHFGTGGEKFRYCPMCNMKIMRFKPFYKVLVFRYAEMFVIVGSVIVRSYFRPLHHLTNSMAITCKE